MTWSSFFKRYGFMIASLLVIANLGVAAMTMLRSKAATCFYSMAEVQNDSRCLYVYSNGVYEKGSKSSPHKNHPCGMDVTSILPSFHFSFSKFTSAHIGDLCTNAPTASPTPSRSPTPSPSRTPTPSPSRTPTPSPTNAPGISSTPAPTISSSCNPSHPDNLSCYERWRAAYQGETTPATGDFTGDGLPKLDDFELWRQLYTAN